MKLSKRIIIAGFALTIAFAPAVGQSAASAETTAELSAEVNEVRFYVTGSNVRIVNSAKQTLQVYSLTGSQVASYRIDSEDKTFSLNLPKGIYILKVGDIARKIALR